MFKIISPNDGYHYFFGYYDLVASQGNDHLAHRVPFMDRLPEANDVAELGILNDGVFTPFAQTTAWNFQQGALLQYHPTNPDTVIYNVNEGGFKTVFAVPEVTPDSTDMRCDLHMRFAFDGKAISFDTTQNGRREIATVPIEILDN